MIFLEGLKLWDKKDWMLFWSSIFVFFMLTLLLFVYQKKYTTSVQVGIIAFSLGTILFLFFM